MQPVCPRYLGFILVIAMLVCAMPAYGNDSEKDDTPWKKFSFNAGAFISAVDSSFRIGSGIGVEIDVEKLLGLDKQNTVFRLDSYWRFTENRRHRLDLTWFSFRRKGSRTILDDITIDPPGGGPPIDIDAGTEIDAFFDLDIYQLSYSYSFFQDDRLDLAVGLGLYLMPMDFGLKVTGLVDDQGTAKFTAPLPVFKLRGDVAITSKWFIRTETQIFYLTYESFTGSILEYRAALEYNPWKHFGIGMGFNAFRFALEADGRDYPEIDLDGTVNFNYTGLQLYLRAFF